MCVYCDLEHKEKLVFEIFKPYENNGVKFEKAVGLLEKALGVSNHRQIKEISPYKAMRELEEQSKLMVEMRVFDLHTAISTKWLGVMKADTDPFKLDKDVFINPITGNPLTKAEWKKIKASLMKAFGYIYKDREELLIKTAMALGKILKTMPIGTAINVPLKDIEIKLPAEVQQLESDPAYLATISFAEEHTGEMIVDLMQHQYTQIHDTILQSQINRRSARQLEMELWDKFADINRDWRRIAETEMANNENNGQIIAELEKDNEGKPVFMIGSSSGGACSWCLNKVNSKVVMMVKEPPSGDGDSTWYKEEQYTAVWPGKSNYGRKRSDWWVASGSQHPHCRCSWVRYEPGYKKTWDKLQDAIDKASKEAEQTKILYRS